MLQAAAEAEQAAELRRRQAHMQRQLHEQRLRTECTMDELRQRADAELADARRRYVDEMAALRQRFEARTCSYYLIITGIALPTALLWSSGMEAKRAAPQIMAPIG